jgi:hypothetical protein
VRLAQLELREILVSKGHKESRDLRAILETRVPQVQQELLERKGLRVLTVSPLIKWLRLKALLVLKNSGLLA